MPVILIKVGRVRDWRTLQKVHRTLLVGQARDLGATRFWVCRNVDDASQVLIVVEGPEHDGLVDLASYLEEHLIGLLDTDANDQGIWEPIEIDGID